MSRHPAWRSSISSDNRIQDADALIPFVAGAPALKELNVRDTPLSKNRVEWERLHARFPDVTLYI